MSDTRLTVAISSRLPQALTSCPEKGRSKGCTFISKVPAQSPQSGLNYERIRRWQGPMIRSLRVAQDIAASSRTGARQPYVLLWIDKHDDAYQWARRRTCHVNASPVPPGVDVGGQPKRRCENKTLVSPAPASLPSSEPTTARPRAANDASHSSRRTATADGPLLSLQQRRLDGARVPEALLPSRTGRLNAALARLDRVAPPPPQGLRDGPHSPGEWQADPRR